MDLTAPPPPPLLTTTTDTINAILQQQQQKQHSSHESTTSTSSSIIIVIIVISSAILVSAAIYLILRYFSRRCSSSAASAQQRAFSARDFVFGQNEGQHQHQHVIYMDNGNNKNETTSLPMFTFSSITGNIAGASKDCAVCLSKFEPVDQLRLLPLCYHAFHVDCIDAWLKSNQTCPLCRANVSPSEADVLNAVHHLRGTNTNNEEENNVSRNNSFRIEIGSISRRVRTPTEVSSDRRSYSVGEYEYVLDDGYEVPVESTATHRRDVPVVDNKDSYAPSAPPEPPGHNLTAEIGNGSARINWLRDYVDRVSVSISSRSQSIRSSGRFFTGSSRRNEVFDDFEATHNRVGEEISELFRWLSGV